MDTFTQLREGEKEHKRRNVQPIVVLAQHAFQLKRPKTVEKDWAWPGDIPAEVLFDPLATVSATYGVAFQTQFRGKEGPWSSRPTIFVIDREGVIRYVNGRPQQDIREKEIFPILDKLSATKAGIK